MNTCNALSLPAYTCFPGEQTIDASTSKSFLETREQLKAQTQLFDYKTPESFMALAFDEKRIQSIKDMVEKLNALQPTDVIVCGIGGSSTGAQAIFNALACGEAIQKPRMYFAEAIDPLSIGSLLNELKHYLDSEKTFSPILLIISKSGTTQETLVNASCFIDFLSEHVPSYQKRVVCISEQNSPLAQVAQKESFGFLDIPAAVSGRFSTFSAVGLLPLALGGANINLLCLGAQNAIKRFIDEPFEANPVMQHAAFLNQHAQTHPISPIFCALPSLAGIGGMYKQLFAESLGKQKKNGTRVGIHPTVSIMTQDLHSIIQLYLDGPQNHMTTFIKGVSTTSCIHSQPLKAFFAEQIFRDISSIDAHMRFVDAVLETYTEEQIPHTVIALGAITGRILGALISEAMITTVLLGNLWQINSFDQPAISRYKKRLEPEQPK